MITGQLVYRRKDAAKQVGLSVTTIEGLYRAGKFPRPVRLTEKAVGWKHDDLKAWVDSREAVTHESEQESAN